MPCCKLSIDIDLEPITIDIDLEPMLRVFFCFSVPILHLHIIHKYKRKLKIGHRITTTAGLKLSLKLSLKLFLVTETFLDLAPRIWNDLPLELRHADISFGQFRNMLKSYLFRF